MRDIPVWVTRQNAVAHIRSQSIEDLMVDLAREALDRERDGRAVIGATPYPSSTVPKDLVSDAANSRVAAAERLLRLAQAAAKK